MRKCFFPAILVIIFIAVYLTGCSFNSNKKIELQSGDIIPSDINFFNVSGTASKTEDLKSKYKVVFYLDSASDECMTRLDCISKMIDLMSSKEIRFLMVWEDRIPQEKLKEAGIDLSYNYSLSGKASLSESKPTAFLADENNRIIMVTGYSYISLINKIIEFCGKKDLSKRAAEMILNNATKSGALLREGNGKTLLMFLSSGCRKCREYEETVRKNIEFMQKKINVLTVRPDFDTKQDSDKYFEIDPQQIYFNIFASSCGIGADNRKYPIFIIINSDKSIEKVFTDTDEAVRYTLGL